ncbi:alpha/beta fold hydrolase [Nonomuraea sp. NPDC050153]|uniref:alpha/beta fold hydrolase n=1 Tax=Nonomuraea sp. NPDC050153 TaxID=3364359 RepID=UPI0037A944D0
MTASLLDHLGIETVALGGTGLGGTVTLRAALHHPHRVRTAIVIGVEDIDDDQAKQDEAAFLDAFAARVLSDGIEAAWAPILDQFPPVVGAVVREAIPRSDPASIAAAAHIGHDRAFRDVGDLAAIRSPTLVIPGTDPRHPTETAEQVARVLQDGHLAPVSISADLLSLEDLAPAIRAFLNGARL